MSTNLDPTLSPNPSPWNALLETIKILPPVKYALGLVGIAAAAALIKIYIGNSQTDLTFLVFVFIGMVLLFVFARRVRFDDDPLPGRALIWGILLFFFAALALTMYAAAIGKPCNWAGLFRLDKHPECLALTALAPPQPTPAPTPTPAPPPTPAPALEPDSPLVVTGVFYVSTGKSPPETLAKQTARVLAQNGLSKPVQILQGELGGSQRNIIVVRASDRADAITARDALRAAGGDLTDASATTNRAWKVAANCDQNRCEWVGN